LIITVLSLFCIPEVFGRIEDAATLKPVIAKITDQGVVNCFSAGLKNDKGDSVSCEPSGVVYWDHRIYFASDKGIAGLSPVFFIPYTDSLNKQDIHFIMNQELINTIKFEDLTITSDNKFIVATTAFDRVKPDHSWDNYNKLLYWESGKEDCVKVVYPSINNNLKSSVNLRKYFSEALADTIFPDGMPYFKIEGLMCLPGNKLLFGVRETGRQYTDFRYRIAIIEADYTVKENTFNLDTNFRLIYDYEVPESLGIYDSIALSSLEYDKFNKRIYMLTSFEHNKSIKTVGGYLWVLSLKNLKRNKPPELVKKANGEPFLFNHKPDGIAVIDKNTVFIVCDDDRVTSRNIIRVPGMEFIRNLNQFAYYIINFE
jgi:hypothetical protein